MNLIAKLIRKNLTVCFPAVDDYFSLFCRVNDGVYFIRY